jgi:hypothetical protein
VAEQQPGGPQLGEPAYRGERDLEVEVGWRGGRTLVSRVRDVDPGRVPGVQVTGLGVHQPHVVLGVARGVVAVQAAAAAEIDGPGVLQGHDAVGGDGREHAEEALERVAVDHPGAGHKPARIGEMPCAPLVDDDLRLWVQRRDVAGAAGVVEVDVRHHDGGEIPGADPEPGQGVADDRGRRRGPGLHQARPVAADQVARGDPVVPGHPGIDLEHRMTQRGNGLVHRLIVADR